uniref:ribosomal protein L33 n=1 Tax=Dapsilanthus disjunctus TaxID=2919630 RepID=UPI001F140FB2|nr:ribosomal protein L33 [Dapsilanthus disjunctus]ULQ65065.1 ribosomal protein L33 [Dapsilanthus disjunctus]ULQ65153.1 ribosomal protein L33 [Dapsilanthus disjunctus]
MAKGKTKAIRVGIILECTSCVQKAINKKSTGISRYFTQKNRHNTRSRLELRKFCRYCHKHTIHGEIKKKKKIEKMDRRKEGVFDLSEEESEE